MGCCRRVASASFGPLRWDISTPTARGPAPQSTHTHTQHTSQHPTFVMPPRRQIEAFREAIEMRKNEGHSNDQIYAFLNEALVANGGSTVSFRTFKRQLSDWGLTASVPSHQKLQPLYEDICD